MNSTTLTVVLAAVALTAGVGYALPSTAADQNTVSTIVRYGDLNIANPDGAKVMLERIKQAARRVCEPRPSTLLEYDEWRGCVGKATEGAVSRLNAPMVTAAYSGKRASSAVLAQNSPR